LKDVELKLVSELLKDSRRSDRDLAKAVGVSQPTVSRLIKKLEKEGVIRGYTVVPDFSKLGYSLMAITFVQLKQGLTMEQTEKARDRARDSLTENHNEIIMLERGLGLNRTGVFLSLHKDYSEYSNFRKWLQNFEFLEMPNIESFLIDLKDTVHYRTLGFSTLAKHILTMNGV
jgi:Lrp/AsnC family transcriptional regulator for asnA, asnC and gidA